MKENKKIKNIANLSATTQNIGYSGKVSVSLLHGKKVVSQKNYYNNGLPDLFKFLGMALCGTYNLNGQPSNIKLFTCSDTKPSGFNWDTSGLIDASTKIPFDSVPILKKVQNSDSTTSNSSNYHYEVTYHFRIPQSYILSKNIKLAAIYSNNSSENKDACAFYLFKTNDDTWDDFEIPESVTDYSLVIEWTMSIMNK